MKRRSALHPVRGALLYAALYSATLALGSVLTEGRTLVRFRAPLWLVIVVHFALAGYVGIMIVLFGKLATTKLRGAILGAAIGFPAAVALILIFRPDYPPDLFLLAAAASALAVGGTIGYMIT